MKNTQNFYCYSNRLHMFLESLGVKYENHGVNSNSKHEYWVYKKGDILDICISSFQELKKKLEEMK